MKDIDFLPIRYRERTALRRAQVWRVVMLGCLGAFVTVIALAQLALRKPIEQQLAAIAAQYPAALVATARADQAQKDLGEIERFAELYTYLRHPWPLTQLLQAVTEPLPDSVVLTEITLDRQPVASVTPAPQPGAAPAAPTTPAEAAKLDLDRLRAAWDGARPSLHVAGVTTDVRKLHAYVSKLAPGGLFELARIESLEAVNSETGIAGSRFELRLQLRPAYGQPEGPRPAPQDGSAALASQAPRSTATP